MTSSVRGSPDKFISLRFLKQLVRALISLLSNSFRRGILPVRSNFVTFGRVKREKTFAHSILRLVTRRYSTHEGTLNRKL